MSTPDRDSPRSSDPPPAPSAAAAETADAEVQCLAELPRILTVPELAKLLRVDRKTVYEALAAGEIPGARRIGPRVYRICRDTVVTWLADGRGRVARSPTRKSK